MRPLLFLVALCKHFIDDGFQPRVDRDVVVFHHHSMIRTIRDRRRNDDSSTFLPLLHVRIDRFRQNRVHKIRILLRDVEEFPSRQRVRQRVVQIAQVVKDLCFVCALKRHKKEERTL